MLAEEKRNQLAANIEANRSQIVERSIEALYKDPYWLDRYGTKGKQRAQQDVSLNLDNLIMACQMQMPSSVFHHYHWLQNVLVNRGMCSLHLQETLDQFSRLFQEFLPDDWQALIPYLEAGYSGLIYEHPTCQRLAQQETVLAQMAAEQLEAELGPVGPRVTKTRKARLFRDQRLHLSYLQDAVGRDKPSLFNDHILWMILYFPQKKQPVRVLRRELGHLKQVIEAQVEPIHAQVICPVLESGMGLIPA